MSTHSKHDVKVMMSQMEIEMGAAKVADLTLRLGYRQQELDRPLAQLPQLIELAHKAGEALKADPSDEEKAREARRLQGTVTAIFGQVADARRALVAVASELTQAEATYNLSLRLHWMTILNG
jgi:hypothetical protein